MLFHFTHVILFLFFNWMNATLRISVKMFLHVNSLSICQHMIKMALFTTFLLTTLFARTVT